MTSLTRSLRYAAPALVVALTLAGCSSSGDGTAATHPSRSPSPSSTVKVPADASLTHAGAHLSFGDSATVIDEPDHHRGTVLKMEVDKVQQSTMKDFSAFILDDQTKASTPYYVTVDVTNVGTSDLGGAPVPLYAVDQDNTLVRASRFTTPFATCPSKPLPKSFAPGDTFRTCLVFLAGDHGDVHALSFRPDQSVEPITWSGDIGSRHHGGAGKRKHHHRHGGKHRHRHSHSRG